jgi:hypothetical protein
MTEWKKIGSPFCGLNTCYLGKLEDISFGIGSLAEGRKSIRRKVNRSARDGPALRRRFGADINHLKSGISRPWLRTSCCFHIDPPEGNERLLFAKAVLEGKFLVHPFATVIAEDGEASARLRQKDKDEAPLGL